MGEGGCLALLATLRKERGEHKGRCQSAGGTSKDSRVSAGRSFSLATLPFESGCGPPCSRYWVPDALPGLQGIRGHLLHSYVLPSPVILHCPCFSSNVIEVDYNFEKLVWGTTLNCFCENQHLWFTWWLCYLNFRVGTENISLYPKGHRKRVGVY